MTAVLTEAPVTFPADWAERANCRSLGLNHFFEDLRIERRGDPYAKARQACNGCDRDVRNACLASAIAEGLRTGFFAGAIPARRLELRRAAQGEGVDVAHAPSLFRYFHRTLA
jgi:hypothetical protein